MATTSTIFITALEARQNPIRERVIHDEGRGIESAILDAVRDGLYSTTVSNGTPMTQSLITSSTVVDIDPTTNTFYVPNHKFRQSDIVQLNSNSVLPSPLVSTKYYFVIYIDPDNIKLAATLQDATSNRPVPISVSTAVTQITLTEQGSGYIVAPTVTLSGGSPTTPASAIAYLAKYGNISAIAVSSHGQGYTDVPSVSIAPQGSGAATTGITFKVVSVSIAAQGSNYRVGDVITVVASGTPSTATVTDVGMSGNVIAVTLANPGIYSVIPTLSGIATTVSPGGGTGCTLNLAIGLNSVGVSTGGSGYTASPRIIIQGGSGVGATATAIVTAGTVSGVTITNAGSGFVSTPTITFSTGENATAIAVLQSTTVAQVMITNNGGDTYTSEPAVNLASQGVNASAGQVYTRVNVAILANSGSGYTTGDILLVAGGAGSNGATIQILCVGSRGEIIDSTLLTGGLYRQIPVLSNNSVLGGTGYAATFNLTMCIDSVDVDNAGSGYVSPPTVTVDGGEGYGAYIVSELTAGYVSRLRVVSGGTGFTSIPTVTITSGSGAVATAYLTPTSVDYVQVDNQGSLYTQATVTIVGNGIDATAHAVILNGQITNIVLDSPGSGYTLRPQAVITGDGGSATATVFLTATSLGYIEVVNQGANYNSPPLVTVSGAATATAVLTATGVDRIDVTDGGDNYTSDPSVYVIVSPDQQGSVISPATSLTRGFAVDHITVTSPGVAYQTAPDVSLSAPHDANGTLAEATAYLGIGEGAVTVYLYPASKDYFAAWKGTTISNENFVRPYVDRMDTVLAYFTNLGYTINRQTNPATGNTIQWAIKW